MVIGGWPAALLTLSRVRGGGGGEEETGEEGAEGDAEGEVEAAAGRAQLEAACCVAVQVGPRLAGLTAAEALLENTMYGRTSTFPAWQALMA